MAVRPTLRFGSTGHDGSLLKVVYPFGIGGNALETQAFHPAVGSNK
jgi:hypothetical protein